MSRHWSNLMAGIKDPCTAYPIGPRAIRLEGRLVDMASRYDVRCGTLDPTPEVSVAIVMPPGPRCSDPAGASGNPTPIGTHHGRIDRQSLTRADRPMGQSHQGQIVTSVSPTNVELPSLGMPPALASLSHRPRIVHPRRSRPVRS